MQEIHARSEGHGSDTDKHQQVVVRFSDVEAKMVEKLKKKYGFKSDRDLFVALIKRAFMSI